MKKTYLFLFLCMVIILISIPFSFSGNTYASAKTVLFSTISDDSICTVIHPYIVRNDHIVQSDLYTWTSKEQIEVLRNSPELLIKSESEKYGKANYDLILESKKAGGDSIAAMLLNERFAKKRFAWPHPWATVRGYPGENYGDQLVRITFKPEAIFCSFVNKAGEKQPYRFYTSNEKEVSLAFVKAHPERIAVVYFVDTKKTTKAIAHYPGTYSRRPRHTRYVKTKDKFPYREYVICNEKMVQSWSYGTAGIISVMKDDVAFLQYLSRASFDHNGKGICLNKYSDDDWSGIDDDFCEYESTIALVNAYYDLNKEQLETTIKTLNAAIKAQGQPFNHLAD